MKCPVTRYDVPITEHCLACGAKISLLNGTITHGAAYKKPRKQSPTDGGPRGDGGDSK